MKGCFNAFGMPPLSMLLTPRERTADTVDGRKHVSLHPARSRRFRHRISKWRRVLSVQEVVLAECLVCSGLRCYSKGHYNTAVVVMHGLFLGGAACCVVYTYDRLDVSLFARSYEA